MYPGILSNLSIVPPVCPNPRPLIFANLAPKDANSGPKISVTLSPTPPVECLSTLMPLMSLRSIESPESLIANAKYVASSSFI